ncbi:CRTAC1 family protein [Niveispirillum fermenti]|uniref:CRTAC1 family protein n=1 Tax=Niveispirillum fermenti TaxID=1233113 RepID=UPI003A857ECB
MFIECSNLIAGNQPALHYGVAVADIDGDGQDEIIVAGYGGPNRVLKWDGQRMVDIADPLIADDGRRAIGLACGDVDGDGREELYILNGDGFSGPKQVMDRLLACFGSRWVDLFALSENMAAANRFAGRSVAVIDRAGSGRYSIAVANHGGPMRLYEMGARGRIVDVAEEVGLDAIAGGRSLLAAPILGDRPDIFMGNDAGPNLLFRNRGDGTFEEMAAALGLDDPARPARGAALMQGEMLFDIMLGNWEGPHRLFQHRAGGGFTDIAPPALAQPSRARTVIVADFDNDGYEEIFINNLGEPNRLFGWRDERWVSIDAGDATLPHGLGTGAAVADLDGDGQLELLVAHGEQAPQPLSLFIAEPRANHWLRVRPLTPAGAPARGAVIRLWAGGRMQMRAICAGSGYLCQMEPVAHFGLGRLEVVERIEIRWPDGAVQRIDRPEPCRMLVIPHPGR